MKDDWEKNLDNTKMNYELANEYIENNLENMDSTELFNMEKRQKNRKQQIKKLKNKIK